MVTGSDTMISTLNIALWTETNKHPGRLHSREPVFLLLEALIALRATTEALANNPAHLFLSHMTPPKP